MPAVSILLPCYNAADTLEAALASLRAQTLADFEIVAVDDGSTDDTLAVLEKWAKEDERIHIIRQPHGGIVTALNAGLATCRGEYVARMDADDLSRPERLALQAQFLDTHPEVGVVSSLVSGYPPEAIREGFQIYIEWLNSLVSDEDIRRELFVESPVAHPSVMFRKAAVLAVGGYQDFGWAEDYDLWLRLYLDGVRFGKVPQTLLDWRDQPERLTRRDRRYSLENFIRAKTHYLILSRQTGRGPLAGCDAV
ncbi:MAG: glycosyltransferase, partial [Anaerolineales bacterium]|nr:glycosyltransferase [Anaerolineales bacterium]